jgi:hypothetical protein
MKNQKIARFWETRENVGIYSLVGGKLRKKIKEKSPENWNNFNLDVD